MVATLPPARGEPRYEPWRVPGLLCLNLAAIGALTSWGVAACALLAWQALKRQADLVPQALRPGGEGLLRAAFAANPSLDPAGAAGIALLLLALGVGLAGLLGSPGRGRNRTAAVIGMALAGLGLAPLFLCLGVRVLG